MVEDKFKFPDQLKSDEFERKINSEDQSQAPLVSIPTIESCHFSLRPLKADDYNALYRVASDPKIWEQHPVPDRHTVEGFLNFWRIIFSCPGSMAIEKNLG